MGSFVWELSFLGSFAGVISCEIVHFETLDWRILLGIFRLGTFVSELSVDNVRAGSSIWELWHWKLLFGTVAHYNLRL